jgi:Sulfotransferase domain
MRIAIISSPRSGNSWVRAVLSAAFEAEELAVHNYLDAYGKLPDKCILQLHWYREPNCQRFLEQNGFRILTLARHPLDILVSVLNFSRHEPETQRWLEGNVELPMDLAKCSPASASFLHYATSWGAENLLSVTYQWWHEPKAIRVRYETLVANPKESFRKIAVELGLDGRDFSIELSRFNLAYFQALKNRHGWQGQPGLWRRLILRSDARKIYLRHRRIFDELGYSIGFHWLRKASAERNWRMLTA